ncbi:MAG TPA: hypothetical protein VJ793_22425 [Anaerolineae bacterium]|nr:hypothetical protein [Anaerolineae bacterium]
MLEAGLLVGTVVLIGIVWWTIGFVRAVRIAPVKERVEAYGARRRAR